ncbi:MAG: hypothetical protein WCY01_01405 [Alkalispirochaeta sp.]
MKRFEIKSAPGQRAVLNIAADRPDGLHVTITRFFDGYETTETDIMTRELFDICVRTGYLTALPETAAPQDVARVAS